MADQDFFITTMPSSRPADYYLGYMDSCVFMDFNNTSENRIYLVRISFDGYGCCEVDYPANALNKEDSKLFKQIIQNNIPNQQELLTIVKKCIGLNKGLVWEDALSEYQLI